jgi:hypothetical protein
MLSQLEGNAGIYAGGAIHRVPKIFFSGLRSK